MPLDLKLNKYNVSGSSSSITNLPLSGKVFWFLMLWPATIFIILGQDIPMALLMSPVLLVIASLYRFPLEPIIAVLLGVASIVFSSSQGVSFSPIFALALVIIPLFAFHFGRAAQDPDGLIWQIGSSASLVGAVSGALLAGSTLLIGVSPRSQGMQVVEANGFLPPQLYAADGVNTAATVLGFIVMIAITHIIKQRKEPLFSKRFNEILLIFGNILLLFYIFALGSRQVMVGIAIFAILITVRSKSYFFAIFVTLLVYLILHYSAFQILGSGPGSDRIANFVDTLVYGSYDINSLSSNRMYLMAYSWDIISKNPIFGLGFDSTLFRANANFNSSSHNYYLTIFLKGGVFFGAFMLYTIFTIWRSSFGAKSAANGNYIWMPFIISASVQALFWDIFLLPIASTAFFVIGGAMVSRHYGMGFLMGSRRKYG